MDIAPYVRDADDLDAAARLGDLDAGRQGRAPARRCQGPGGRVPLPGPARRGRTKLAKDRPVWRLTRWRARGPGSPQQPQSRARPGEVLLVIAADGGYDPDTGFDPAARSPVPGQPGAATPKIDGARPDGTPRIRYGQPTPASVPAAVTGQSLDQHSERGPRPGRRAARSHARPGICRTGPPQPPSPPPTCTMPARRTRSGRTRCAPGRQTRRRPRSHAGRRGPSPAATARLQFAGGVAFRHELASLLLLDGPLRACWPTSPDPDLTRYLVLAHHGKLRVQVRDPGDLAVLPPARPRRTRSSGLSRARRRDIPAVLGQPAATLTVDLDQFQLGGDRSWTRTALGLRDRYGPFVLAYLETLVRVADWRASGGTELPDDNDDDHPAPAARAAARAAGQLPGGPGPDPGARRAGRPGRDGGVDAGRAGHHDHGARLARMARR